MKQIVTLFIVVVAFLSVVGIAVGTGFGQIKDEARKATLKGV